MPPWLVRNLILPTLDRLIGRPTAAMLRELTLSQHATHDELRVLQTRKLRALLSHAHARCRGYRARIDAAAIEPAVANLESLARLPTLSKDDIRAAMRPWLEAADDTRARRDVRTTAVDHHDSLCDPVVPGGLHRYTTGGSSGEPLIFFVDRRRQAADQAARTWTRRWFGIEPGDRELYLWGAPVELRAHDRLRSLRDRLINHRLISAFDMTPRAMDAALHAMRRFRPVHVFGYPSSLARLAEHAMAQVSWAPSVSGRRSRGATESQNRTVTGFQNRTVTGFQNRTATVRERRNTLPATVPRLARAGGGPGGPAPRAVFTTGEPLLPCDRDTLQAFFGVPVADGYGSREAGFIAHECPAGRMHVNMGHVIVELLDDAGRPVAAEEPGEIVVTHLEAWGMPLIRYRTGDVARWNSRPCPCGLAHAALAGIEGRRGDLIRTPEGNAAHALAAIYPLRECPYVRRFHVVQRADFSLDVFVTGELPEAVRARLERDVARQFRDRLTVRLHVAADLPPAPSGKHVVVRSEVETESRLAFQTEPRP
ncbi:MAG: phenylacetate--CoA ligase family protein [Phycisphaerae bacterium]|nr:AMP-binding protein [Phycisphaerae bacterium]NUQ47639.1 phenylacetate--CoA ligase family protein [Phycisphaerae bacterium]